MLSRRALLLTLAATHRAPRAAIAPAGAALQFPADFGAHGAARIEWWYVTGELRGPATPVGFQITFFRASTGLAGPKESRFAARDIVFAHAAVTDLGARRLRHDQRVARAGFGIAEASPDDTQLTLRDWRLERSDTAGQGSAYRAAAASVIAGFAFDLQLQATQPVLLQGRGGYSRKGPGRDEASRYYSEPQLAVRGTLALDGKPAETSGRAWLDHEWSDSLLDRAAVGWDWIGMNLDGGAALTAFRLRRADGSTLWAGGSYRPAGGAVRDFAADEVVFVPGRTWLSAATRARYPVEWQVATPAGAFRVRALLDDQELDSRASVGSVYWEGLSQLDDEQGRRLGRGYLEMTGYAGRLQL
ncbi:MAG: carotenoid 1,2-hydratase [Caldimonas sp.]